MFFGVMAAAAAVDLAVLFLTAYPGVVTPDSVSQLEQVVSGAYTNHHPFYHTMLIRACVAAGQALFRWMYGVGTSRRTDCVLIVLGSLGMCLLRSNGLTAFALTLIVTALVLRKKGWRILVVLTAVLAAAPVLDKLDVTQPNIVESLSIPLQQVARVITDCDDLTAEERELLEHVVDVDAVPDVYDSVIYDPLKTLILNGGGVDYLVEHKEEYLRLWFRLLLRHPGAYIAAWIDQTRGYWNGGYNYWIWTRGVAPNEEGISLKVVSGMVLLARDIYCYMYRCIPLLEGFVSIGLHIWITMALGFFAILRRSRAALLTVPVLAVVLTLLVATPVASEFRYAYAVFTCLPMTAAAVFYQDDKEALAGHG